MEIQILINGNTVNAKFIGRLDTVAASKVASDMQTLMDNADKNIVMDCSTLEYISSSGLRLFLSLRKKTMTMGGKVVIEGLLPDVRQVFIITGFSSLFELK